MKKITAILLALVLVLAMSTSAMAQTVDSGKGGTASITINNASKGETYAVYKLFDATVNDDGTSIAYTGNIPESLKAYFQYKTGATSNIEAVADTLSEDAIAAMKAWAEDETATATATSDGSALTFTTLPYGYYVVTTTQGAAITVDSTKPNASIYDKNSTEMMSLTKTVDDDDVSFGDTVTYTVEFVTSNYVGKDSTAQKVTKYTVEDTLPEFLSQVTVMSVVIDGDANTETTEDQTSLEAKDHQFEEKKFEIAWTNPTTGDSLYENGAKVIITYTAVVTDKAAIAGAGNTNTVTVTNDKSESKLTASDTIWTYAIALKKVNDEGEALANATFQLPFYVKETADTDGAYIYAGSAESEGLVNKLTTPESGEIQIKGVASGEYTIAETAAPAGYNKLTNSFVVTATKSTATETDKTFVVENGAAVVVEQGTTATGKTVSYTDADTYADVVVVVNVTGESLPSTGGMGTTLFYVVGGMMMAAAVVLLVAKKKVSAK